MILIVKQFGSFSVELFMARPQEQQMMLDCDLTNFGKLISEYVYSFLVKICRAFA